MKMPHLFQIFKSIIFFTKRRLQPLLVFGLQKFGFKHGCKPHQQLAKPCLRLAVGEQTPTAAAQRKLRSISSPLPWRGVGGEAVVLIFILFISCHSSKTNHRFFHYNQYTGITSLDPAFAHSQGNMWAMNQLYNGLLQMNDSLQLKPCIAKSWNISADGLTYTFLLRGDIFFHDNKLFVGGKGRRVVATDVVYSFKRLIDEKTASTGAWIFNSHVAAENPFAAVNDSVFEIHLLKPFHPLLSILTMQYCSIIPYEVADYYGKDFSHHPIGTGAFKFKEWQAGSALVFVKNEHYFEKENGKQLPNIDGVMISFLPDKNTEFLSFLQGKIDFISGLDASYKDEMLNSTGELNSKYADKIKLLKSPYLNTEYLGMLQTVSSANPLSNKLIRQAINYGFDRKQLITYLRNGVGKPATAGIIPIGLNGFDAEKVIGFNFNQEKARALLKQAGFENGKNLPTIKLFTNANYEDIATAMSRQLKEIGINLKIELLPMSTLREMMSKGEVGFFRGSWIADYPDAENYMTMFYSHNTAPPNYTRFANASFDKLYEQALQENNDSIRYSLYQQMDIIVIDEAAVVPLFYDEVLRFTQPNVKGLGANPFNMLQLKRVTLE